MIHHATQLIDTAFAAEGIKYRVDEVGDKSLVDAGFSIKNGPNVIVHFISADEDNDVSVRVLGLINEVDEESRAKVYPILNQLHRQYRYVKFVLDDDGDINVEYDFPSRTSDELLGRCCVEMFVRMMSLCKQAYPEIMRAIL